MSILLDIKYVDKISFYLEGFSWKKENAAQSRCPICGDSKKSKRKKRFNIFRTKDKDSLSVKCFNCDYSNYFGVFLKDYYPVIYAEYRRESFFEYSSKNRTKIEDKKPIVINYRTDLKYKDKKNDLCQNLDCIEFYKNSTSKKYIEDRKIPKKMYEKIWYSENFKKSAEHINIESSELLVNEPRLVIPFFNEDNELIGIQGRDLTGKSSRKYITILQNEHCPKIYGLERLDKNKPIFVVEGAFDSMFISNCISTNDLNLLRFDHENSIYIFDKEYRKLETVKQIEKAIKLNKKIVLFPKEIKCKDINEMVLAGYDVNEIINKNIVAGLKAKLLFQSLKGI